MEEISSELGSVMSSKWASRCSSRISPFKSNAFGVTRQDSSNSLELKSLHIWQTPLSKLTYLILYKRTTEGLGPYSAVAVWWTKVLNSQPSDQ